MDRDAQAAWWAGGDATVDLQELATLGPAGLRVGLLGNPAHSLRDHVTAQELTRNTSRSVNYAQQHTIAQPVCAGTQDDYFSDDLRGYFRDVLFPMAHTVHVSPVASYCSTWAVEYAVYASLERIHPDPEHPDQEHPARARQRELVELWKQRCDLQLEQIGICQLRGVFDVEPKAGHDEHAHCEFTVEARVQENCKDGEGRQHFYVTPNCLVHAPLPDAHACAAHAWPLTLPAGQVRAGVLRSLYVRGQ